MATATTIAQTQQKSLTLRTWTPGLGLVAVVSLYVVLMPSTNLLPDLGVYDTKRLFQVILLLGMGLWLIGSAKARSAWLETFYGLPRLARGGLVSMVGLGCLAAALAPLPGYAFLEVSYLTLLFLLIVTLASFYQRSSKKAEQLFLWMIVLSVLFYEARFFTDYVLSLTGLQYAFRGQPGAIWPNGELRSFVHIRHFNQFQTWTLPLVALPALLFADRGRLVRWSYTVLAMVWWMLLFGSGGRGTIVAFVGAMVVVGLLFSRRALPWLRVQGLAAGGGALLYVLFFKILANTNASLTERSLTDDSYRFQLWETAWEMIRAHPLFGAGPMHYAHGASVFTAHPHNAVLQWASEWGTPAALLAVGLILWGLGYSLLRLRRDAAHAETASSGVHVRIAVAATVLAATAHALVSGIIVMPMSQVMLALVVGWCWGLCGPRPAAYTASRFRTLFFVLLTAATVTVTSWTVARDAFVLKERKTTYFETADTPRLRPRFWFVGNIDLPD